MRAGFSVDRTGLGDLRYRSGADHRRKLRQYSHPALLVGRKWRDVPIRLEADRRTGDHPATDFARQRSRGTVCRSKHQALEKYQRTARDGDRRHGIADRAASRSLRLLEIGVRQRMADGCHLRAAPARPSILLKSTEVLYAKSTRVA